MLEELERRLCPAAVGFGHGANGLDGGRQEIRGEGEGRAAPLEFLAVLFTMRDRGAHIGFEHAGDVRRRAQEALHHVLGDALANGGVRKPGDLKPKAPRSCSCCARCVAQDISDGDSPASTRALDLRGLEPALTQEPAYRGAELVSGTARLCDDVGPGAQDGLGRVCHLCGTRPIRLR